MTIADTRRLFSESNPRVINSPPFTVTNCAMSLCYKMCIRVKISKTDVAIGVAIMSGANDRQLLWPFSMIVMFRLINQRGKEDRVKVFRSDRNGHRLKESLSKPKTDKMNLAMGFPSFVPRQCLSPDGFIKEDSIVLESYLFPKDTKMRPGGPPTELPSTISFS